MQSVATYPVRVDGQLDPGLSRWLWLVKWLLAIPHFVVLVFLWLAFIVLSVVAFFAILFTGRYPRGIFDFNVGVLRWTWRVSFYALRRARHRPLPAVHAREHDPTTRRTSTFDYPEHLSRGLVLVKWWLLAIPHYLIVGLFLGGGVFAWRYGRRRRRRRPDRPAGADRGWRCCSRGGTRAVFRPRDGDEPVGARVVAYAALMTDAYPPFRLDAGPDDPAGPIMSDAATTTREQAAATARRLRRRPDRVDRGRSGRRTPLARPARGRSRGAGCRPHEPRRERVRHDAS